MANIDKIYWENDTSSSVNLRISCYNNLFGFPYMTEEKLLAIDSCYQAYLNSFAGDALLNRSIYSFIESFKENCSEINLLVTYTFTPLSSSNLLLLSDKELIPLRKVNENWFCLNPKTEFPQVILPPDLEKLIESMEGENFMYDFNFDPFPISPLDHLYDLTQILHLTRNIIKLLVCKPNGHFVEYFSYPDYPVNYLLNYMKSKTGYNNIRLTQKLSNNYKLIITNPNLPIKDLVSSPSSNNLIFCELIKASECNI